MERNELISSIKKKKELAALSDSYIEGILGEHIRRHNIAFPLKEKDAKLLIKAIRAQLRRQAGMFSMNQSSKSKPLHLSSHERAENYSLLHKLIAELKPQSILDLGCGLNPLELATKHLAYYAYDINEGDIVKVQLHLDRLKNTGFAKVADVLTEPSFPNADLCLMLKLVDLLDKKGHKNAERLIDKVSSHHFIVSFSTKTISGKPMNFPQRGWIERLCARKGFTFRKYISANEIFYLMEKP